MGELQIGDGCGLKLPQGELEKIVVAQNCDGAPCSELFNMAVRALGPEIQTQSLGKALPRIEEEKRRIANSNRLEPGLDAGYHWLSTLGAFSVSTIDAMTPPVRDPKTFGEIAALHMFSDLFVSGVPPETVQQYLLAPSQANENDLGEVLGGFRKICDQFNTSITGGHSRQEGDNYLLGGTATGYAKERLNLNKPLEGDLIVMTKALGTSIAITADKMLQQGYLAPEDYPVDVADTIAAARRSMTTDNSVAVPLRQAKLVTACTDITGFGVVGHLSNLVNPWGNQAVIHTNELPIIEGVDRLLTETGVHTHAGDHAQIKHAEEQGQSNRAFVDLPFNLAFQPETSGGILATVRPELLENVKSLVEANGQMLHIIGEITEERISVEALGRYRLSGIVLQ